MSILQMSAAGAVMILVITVIRALTLDRLPKTTFLVLWAAALLRLLVPFSVPSGLSIYSLLARKPAAPPVTGAYSPAAALPVLPADGAASAAQTGAAGTGLSVWSLLWAAGMVLCAAVFTAAYIRSCREFRMFLPVENDAAQRWLQSHPLRRTMTIRQSDRIASPLTFGILRPVILLPKETDWTDETALRYVLEHEYVHIRRWDAASKLLLTAAVCVHWFDPMVWVMYVLAERDLELSCDEAVVRRFGRGTRAAYARVLIRMEETKSGFAPLGSHFSRNAMEERITAIMKIRKTTVVSLITAAALVAGTVTVFATTAKPEADNKPEAAALGGADVRPEEELLAASAVTIEEETLLSYVDPQDGKTYYSFDDGRTYQPLTDAEFEELYPTPDIEWWTYDEFKAWLDDEKVQLQSLLGTSDTVNGKTFVWTQEEIDKTIAMYEDMLADMKNGVMYSKSVDGQEDTLASYDPTKVAKTTSSAALELSITLHNGEEHTFGPFGTEEELLAAVKPFCEEQAAQGNLSPAEVQEILGRYGG